MKEGWQVRKIGEVCDLATGGTPSRAIPEFFGGSIRWLVSGDIHRREIFDCDGRITEAGMKASNAKLLPINSVMIALNGQGKTRGTVALLRTAATCNQSLVSIAPRAMSSLMPEFLFANLHGRYEEIRRLTSDADNDRRGLNMGMIREIAVPIAPLSEQRRIVAILDEAFDGIATAKANAEKNLQNAREWVARQLTMVLAAGSVTGDHGTLESLVASGCSLSYGIVQPGDEMPNGLPVVRPVDLGAKTVRAEGLKRIDPALARSYARTTLEGGDLLLCVRGTTGTVAVAEPALAGANVTRGIVPIRFDPRRVSQALGYYLLRSEPFQGQVRAKTYGTALMQINIGDLRQIVLKVPAMEQQAALVEQLDAMQEAADRLASVYCRKAAALHELKQSLLHQAFSGAL